MALGYNRAHPAALRNMELVVAPGRKTGDALRARAAETRWDTLEVGIQAAVCRAAGRFEGGAGKTAPPNNGRATMKAAMVRFLRDEQGQDLVEYALIVAAVGLALITTVNQLSAGIVSLYQSITGDLSSIGTPAA